MPPTPAWAASESVSLFPDESVLMDLKALLLEAKQKVPPVLQVLHCGDETMLDIGGERPRDGPGTSHGAAGRPALQTGPVAPACQGCLRAVVAWPCGQTWCCSSMERHWHSPSAPGVGGPLSWHGTTPPDLIPPIAGERGCAFCGGLGHRITDCPKLEAMQTKQVSNIGRKDYLAHSSMDF